MIISKLWLDTEDILLGCQVYSEQKTEVKRFSHYDDKGYSVYQTIELSPKEELILSMDDMFLNNKEHEYMNSNGDGLKLVEYDDTTNIGEPITRYKVAYVSNGRIITDMQRVKYIGRDIMSAENMPRRDFRYLIESFTMMDLYPVEVL